MTSNQKTFVQFMKQKMKELRNRRKRQPTEQVNTNANHVFDKSLIPIIYKKLLQLKRKKKKREKSV